MSCSRGRRCARRRSGTGWRSAGSLVLNTWKHSASAAASRPARFGLISEPGAPGPEHRPVADVAVDADRAAEGVVGLRQPPDVVVADRLCVPRCRCRPGSTASRCVSSHILSSQSRAELRLGGEVGRRRARAHLGREVAHAARAARRRCSSSSARTSGSRRRPTSRPRRRRVTPSGERSPQKRPGRVGVGRQVGHGVWSFRWPAAVRSAEGMKPAPSRWSLVEGERVRERPGVDDAGRCRSGSAARSPRPGR